MLLMSIGVGSLFLVALEYVAGADWSTPIRRIPEHLASLIPVLIILSIPLLLNLSNLFHWTHPGDDKLLIHKAPYLNVTFFIFRVFVCLALWGLFYVVLTRNSRKQDTTGEQLLTKRNIKLSAIFIPLFAITITIAAVDWMMSLEPHWFSTIFGVYYFAGSVVAALSAVTILVVNLKEKGYLSSRLTNDHLFSLGALLFAFINFWAYIAFSQYMLIWYADLPEETFWFLHRWDGIWAYVSILLIIMNFVVPYIVLLSQPAKMDPKKLKFVAVWLLIAKFVDYYWLIIPNMKSENTVSVFSWMDIAFPVAFAGLIMIVFNERVKKTNLIPVGDPKLERGLNFHL
ncbi:MAG: quinol:cytochrome C oxidoreductase [Ignavibacteriales bacterium]|nr:MAG: quinol:cytochrome C oxidoreductase [Ignavibacteriales bacterium]